MWRREERLVGRRRVGEARRLLAAAAAAAVGRCAVSLLSCRGVAADVGLFVAAVMCVVVVCCVASLLKTVVGLNADSPHLSAKNADTCGQMRTDADRMRTHADRCGQKNVLI
jgi:hypothetical protein